MNLEVCSPFSILSMNLEEYWAQVNEWKSTYDVRPPPISAYSPIKVNACCKKCKDSRRRMNRHHKCNDYFFAKLLPDVYAKRYCEFRDSDCDQLCDTCHKSWHRYVKPKLRKMYLELYEIRIGGEKPNKKWCEEWRVKILNWYIVWLEKPRKSRPNSKRRRKKRAKAAKKQSSSNSDL